MTNLRNVACNICGSEETVPVTVQSDYRVVRCVRCGLVYVNPRPDNESLKGIYDSYHQRNGKDESDWKEIMALNFKSVSSMLTRMYPSGGRLLDIGCGYGYFIETMERCGWHAEGIDPSSTTVAFAGQNGLKVTETTIDEASFPDGSFNAVTMFYVLEHLTDPLAALKKVERMLVPGGVAVIRVPHTTPLVRVLSIFGIKNNLYDPPFHLYDFSAASLRRIIKNSGFETVTVRPGEPTLPPSFLQKLISVSTGYAAKFLYQISSGHILAPGVSKTAVALKSRSPGGRA